MLLDLKSFYSKNALVYKIGEEPPICGIGADPIQGTIYMADGSIKYLQVTGNSAYMHTTIGQFRIIEKDAKTINENTKKLLNMINYGNIFGDTSDDLK